MATYLFSPNIRAYCLPDSVRGNNITVYVMEYIRGNAIITYINTSVSGVITARLLVVTTSIIRLQPTICSTLALF